MELADDIAYGVHDLEDAVVTGTLSAAQWYSHVDAVIAQLPADLAKLMEQLSEQLFAREHHLRKNAIGALVNIFVTTVRLEEVLPAAQEDRKSTRLNSSHVRISYAVFCLKKK